MKFCNSHLTRNIFNLYMRRFFFGLVYVSVFHLHWLGSCGKMFALANVWVICLGASFVNIRVICYSVSLQMLVSYIRVLLF